MNTEETRIKDRRRQKIGCVSSPLFTEASVSYPCFIEGSVTYPRIVGKFPTNIPALPRERKVVAEGINTHPRMNPSSRIKEDERCWL
jgi:hypothetical protein